MGVSGSKHKSTVEICGVYFLQMCIAWKQCCCVVLFETAKRRTGPKINISHDCSKLEGQRPELVAIDWSNNLKVVLHSEWIIGCSWMFFLLLLFPLSLPIPSIYDCLESRHFFNTCEGLAQYPRKHFAKTAALCSAGCLERPFLWHIFETWAGESTSRLALEARKSAHWGCGNYVTTHRQHGIQQNTKTFYLCVQVQPCGTSLWLRKGNATKHHKSIATWIDQLILILTLPRSGLLSWLSLTRTFAVFCPNVEAKTHYLSPSAWHRTYLQTVRHFGHLFVFEILPWVHGWRLPLKGADAFIENFHADPGASLHGTCILNLNHHSNPGNHDPIQLPTSKARKASYPGPQNVGIHVIRSNWNSHFLLRGWCGMVFLSFGSFQVCQKSSFRGQSQQLDSEHSKSIISTWALHRSQPA